MYFNRPAKAVLRHRSVSPADAKGRGGMTREAGGGGESKVTGQRFATKAASAPTKGHLAKSGDTCGCHR